MEKSKSKERIEFQNWKNGRRVVYYNPKGERIFNRQLKGSGMRTKKEFYELVNRKNGSTGTLWKDRFLKIHKFPGDKGTIEYKVSGRAASTIIHKNNTKTKNVGGKQITLKQFEVSGSFKGKDIVGRSKFMGHLGASNEPAAKASARQNFWRMVSFEIFGTSDEWENTNLKERIKYYHEGWVYYNSE